MLTISSRHRQAFADASRQALARRLAERFSEFFPVQTTFSGIATLVAASAAAIARAEAFGCTTERDAARYLLLSWQLGHEFGTDPRHPWAAQWLMTSADTTAAHRLDQLLTLANAQLDLVHGPENGALVKSLLRVRRLQQQDFDAAGTDPQRCAAWLGELMPAWQQQADVLMDIAAAAPVHARQLGITDPASVAIVALHAALLGHGFATDPLYPWAGAALAGSAPDRAEKLFAASLRYLDAILE